MSNVQSQSYLGDATKTGNDQVRPGRGAVGFTVDVFYTPGTPAGIIPERVDVVATCGHCHEPIWPATGPKFVEHARIHKPDLPMPLGHGARSR